MSHPQTQHKPLRHISLYTPALMAFDIFVLLDHIYNFISYHTTQTISSILYITRDAVKVILRLLSAGCFLIPADLSVEPFQSVGQSSDLVDETALQPPRRRLPSPRLRPVRPSSASFQCDAALDARIFHNKIDDAFLNPPEIIERLRRADHDACQPDRWMVIAADGAMMERFAATASGTPMECPPPSTSDTVGFFHAGNEFGDTEPGFDVPPAVFKRMSCALRSHPIPQSRPAAASRARTWCFSSPAGESDGPQSAR